MMTYHDLLSATALRINALGNNGLWNATTAAGLQTVYEQRPLIVEMFQSSIFPMNAIRDAIIACEGKIAEAVAQSNNRTLRSYLRALSDPLAGGLTGAPIPTLAATKPVIGNLGAILDEVDGTPYTPMPVALVRNRLLSPNIYLVPAYYFANDGSTIFHTGTSVVAECCVYSASDQTDDFNFNREILFPDALAEVYLNGAMALLVRDDEFLQQSTQYGQMFTAFLATLPPATFEAQAA
jgi:hypothetical protein